MEELSKRDKIVIALGTFILKVILYSFAVVATVIDFFAGRKAE